jgi:protein-S-isoprenylcysteine O-methyltransferase Ste14
MNNFTRNISLINKEGVRSIFREFFVIIFCSIILFVSAGTIKWINAWVYIALVISIQIALTIVLIIKNPYLLNERGQLIRKGTKTYDTFFVIIYFILIIILSIIAGFDAVRYQWTALPFCFIYPGSILILLSSLNGMWAMSINPFFAGTQRIQNEKSHQVINSGPYKYIRHPGYLSWILSAFCYPFILGSIVSFILVFPMIIIFIIRTYLEDISLQKELAGYIKYTQVTKYKLIPYVW